MKKLIFQLMISLDGYFEGPNKELDWHNVDEEYNNYAIELLNNSDALLFGRVTYQLMESYWPKPEVVKNDPIVAERMNNLPKMVFSKTLKNIGPRSENWKDVQLVGEIMPDKIRKLKQSAGKNLMILGSATLAKGLLQYKLIDELQITVNPVVLGEGNSFFRGIKDITKLNLIKSSTFKSGNVLLCYQPTY